MIVITVTYTLVWTLDFADEYGWTKCGKCFNIKRQKELKQVTQGGSIGYNIKGKFYTLTKLKNHLVKIKCIKSLEDINYLNKSKNSLLYQFKNCIFASNKL